MRKPGGKLLHFPDGAWSLFLEQELEVTLDELVFRRDIRLRGRQSVFQFMNLPEYPGIAQGTPANHHPVTTRFPLHPERIFGCDNISVSNHRDLQSRFQLADQIPIRV